MEPWLRTTCICFPLSPGFSMAPAGAVPQLSCKQSWAENQGILRNLLSMGTRWLGEKPGAESSVLARPGTDSELSPHAGWPCLWHFRLTAMAVPWAPPVSSSWARGPRALSALKLCRILPTYFCCLQKSRHLRLSCLQVPAGPVRA